MWLVLLAAMLWGTTGTAQAFAPDVAQPHIIGALRLLVGSTGLLLLAWQRRLLRLPTRAEIPTLLTGAIGVAAYQVLFFVGVSRTGVAIGTIVGIGSSPIIAGLLDWLVNRQALSHRWFTATALAIIGCILLILPGEQVTVEPLGIVLTIGAGAMYAVYAVANQRLLHTMHPDTMSALVFGLAMVLLLPLLFTGDLGWVLQPNGLLVVLWLGLVTLTLSYMCFARGLQVVPASTAVTLSLSEPLTAGLLGVFLVGERPPPIALLGICLMLVGLWWLTRAQPTP